MTSIDRPVLTVRSTADLITAVPYLLGFHPADSAVVVAMRDRRVVFAARADLPGERPGGTAVEVADYLTAVVERQGVESVTILGYGVAGRVTPAVDALRAAFGRVGRPVADALRVTDGRYWSYLCENPECCPPEGVPLDRDASPIAAAATVAGQVALPDRAALAGRIAPVQGADQEAMRAATARARTRLADLLAGELPIEPGGDRIIRRAGEPAVRQAVERYRVGDRLSDDEVAWLSLLLTHVPVRDHAWERIGCEDFHLALWTDVVRRVEPELVPAPACLLAFAAWRGGQGALASLALERALGVRPDYSMALLLEDVLRQGVPPSTLDGWPELTGSESMGSESTGPERGGARSSGGSAPCSRRSRPGRRRSPRPRRRA